MICDKTKQDIEKNYIDTIRLMIEAQSVEEALDLNIRKYEQALATDAIDQIAYCIYCFGVIEETKGHIPKAMTYYTRATRISREYSIEECLVAALNNRGNIYSVHGELHLAISKYIEALTILQTSKGGLCERVKILNNIGVLYIEMGDYKKASEYMMEALDLVKTVENDELIGKITGNLTEIFLRIKDVEQAKKYNHDHYKVAIKNPDGLENAFVKVYEALILSKENAPWQEVQELFEEGMVYFNDDVGLIDQCEMINLFARESIEREQYEFAIEWLEAMLVRIYDKNYRNIEITALSMLESIYKRQNDILRAYDTLTRLSKVKEYAYAHLKEKELERVNKTIERSENKESTDASNREYDDVRKLQKSIQILKTLSETGKYITSCTRVDELVETFYRQLRDMFPFDGFGIGIKHQNNTKIDYYYFESSEGEMHKTSIPIHSKNYMMSLCVQNSQEIIIYDADNVYNGFEDEDSFNAAIAKIARRSESKSILFSPIVFEKETMGGITMQSASKNMFTYVDLESLRIVASYVAIAVTNILRAHELIVANEKLREMSLRDSLTDVYNRRALEQYMQNEFASRAERNLPACAMMLDVDFFKQFNDNYGHVRGDICLQEITKTLHKVLRRYRYHVFRYGGDEFFILVERCNKEQAIDVLKALNQRIKLLDIIHEHSEISSRVTVSIGAVIIDSMGEDYAKVFNKADQALYKVKENGRNSYHLI